MFRSLAFYALLSTIVLTAESCNMKQEKPDMDEAAFGVIPGIEVLQRTGWEILQNKRVGLVTNPTGVDRMLTSSIDLMHNSNVVNIVALFGPEHGVRGDFSAGDHIDNQVDDKTGLPVFSLYGKNRMPDSTALSLVDVLVYDIQDIGVRSYTYISTMGKVMEAAAKYNKEVVILDRPNPLGGMRVEGPGVEDGFYSFISQYDIPYVYGLTCGELALMLNAENMLEGGVKCNLHVVPMEGWKRDMTFKDTGLPWVPTSPHIPTSEHAMFYACTGIIGEIDPNLIGIGYTLPFQTLVTQTTDAEQLASIMNDFELEGVIFRPIHYKPYYKDKAGKLLSGVQIHITDPDEIRLTQIQFYFLKAAKMIDPEYDLFKDADHRFRMFDLGCGSDKIRNMLMNDADFDKILEAWNHGTDTFQKRSSEFYLY
jgi:uncharacterized protein YbbC (DUF1343 family)